MGTKMNADMVSHPQHYSGKVECIDCIESAISGVTGIKAFCLGNAIKYIYRQKEKGGDEDIRKAIWYLEKSLR